MSSFLKMTYIMLSEKKKEWTETETLGLNCTADFSWYSWSKILSCDWSVSLKVCSGWLVNLQKINFNFVHGKTNWSDRLLNCFLSQLKIFSSLKSSISINLWISVAFVTIRFDLPIFTLKLSVSKLTMNDLKHVLNIDRVIDARHRKPYYANNNKV